ncbi:MAG: ABC transporter transmembrane domain-containing protein [Desulfovermiculus sp.]|nr:ABC transporter transmembrane domain-containing protein [Desulfovermiculus sp.]
MTAIKKPFTKEDLKSSLYFLRRIAHYFRPYALRIVLSIIAMAFVATCTAAAAYLVQPALDEIFINKDKKALMVIPFLIILVFALKGFFRVIQTYQMQYCALRVLEALRNDLQDKMVRLPMSFFEQSQVGMLMSRIINDVNLIRRSIPEVIMLVREVMTMFALIFVAFYRNAYLATWAIVVLPLALYPVIFFGKKLRKLGRRNQAKIADISTLLQELFSGIKAVKAFAMEGAESRRFQGQNSKLVHIALRGALYESLSSPVMEFIGALGIGMVVWYGGTQVIAGESTPGTFFSFLTALIMLYEPFKRISKSNMVLQQALAGAERVFEILDSPDINEEKAGRAVLTSPLTELRFERVDFAYPGARDMALKDISLDIRPGERLAIVGPSGAGKSSLVQLIPRFYEPQSGRIVLNGRPVEEYTLDSLRRCIGIVSQETILFNTSIRDNITYGLDNVPDSRLEEATKVAYAFDFITNLPRGFGTVIGERGVKLSGGEKQRLTIARALLKDPPLLILDEATSALDTQSERIVQKALENLMAQRTSMVIAHRLSTVLSADRIVVMDSGSILDIGPHRELYHRSPLYHKLYQMQFEDGAEGVSEIQ